MGFPALVCGPGARRLPEDRPCMALSAAASAPRTGPQPRSPLAVCGSAAGHRSPNNTPIHRMLRERREGCFYLLIFFSPSFSRLTYLPPSASGCLKTSLGVLLLTHSPSSTRPLFIPQPVSTFDKETVQSLFSLPPSACRCHGDL